VRALHELTESHSPRSLRRYLDYGKRLRSRSGLDELRRWLGKILLDDGSVYDLSDRSMAFEVASCERIRAMWATLEEVTPEVIALGGPVDKMGIYRRIFDPGASPARRAALLGVMKERYRRTWTWLRDCSVVAPAESEVMEEEPLLQRFLETLDKVDPVGEGGASQAEELERLGEVIRRRDEDLRTLTQELEVAEDRATRAHQRAKGFESESKQMRRQLRDERENGEKLRQERSRRIKVERETRDSINELQRLRSEYVKLDERLREMAHRAAKAEARGKPGGAAGPTVDLSPLRGLAAAQLLGLVGPPGAEELNRARRQFAAALHSDRVSQLPRWVGELFDELMGIVNETCDRSAAPGSSQRRRS